MGSGLFLAQHLLELRLVSMLAFVPMQDPLGFPKVLSQASFWDASSGVSVRDLL